MRSIFVSILAFCFLLVSGIALCADSTAFDPTLVAIKAKGAGGVPVGTIISWPVATDPEDMDNWLECNGQSISQSAYPELFAVVGNQVPDLRGVFLRGHGGNSAALGIQQSDAIRNIYGSIAGYNGGIRAMNGAFKWGWNENATSAGNNFNIPSGVYFDASLVVPTANENRPVNQAVRYLIRARP